MKKKEMIFIITIIVCRFYILIAIIPKKLQNKKKMNNKNYIQNKEIKIEQSIVKTLLNVSIYIEKNNIIINIK